MVDGDDGVTEASPTDPAKSEGEDREVDSETEEADGLSDSPSPVAGVSEGPAGSVNERQVLREEAAAYAQECGLLFYEASAKTGANVGEVFTEIGKLFCDNSRRG